MPLRVKPFTFNTGMEQCAPGMRRQNPGNRDMDKETSPPEAEFFCLTVAC
jgi:hypothetical protein